MTNRTSFFLSFVMSKLKSYCFHSGNTQHISHTHTVISEMTIKFAVSIAFDVSSLLSCSFSCSFSRRSSPSYSRRFASSPPSPLHMFHLSILPQLLYNFYLFSSLFPLSSFHPLFQRGKELFVCRNSRIAKHHQYKTCHCHYQNT